MAEASTPEAPVEKPLVELEWDAVGLNSTLYNTRKVKLAKPVCEPCQKSRRRGWWLTCPHQPYLTQQPREVVEPIVKCAECGEDVPDKALAPDCHPGAEMLIEGERTRRVMRVVPRTVEIPLALSNDSGRSVEIAMLKGCVYPHTLGFADMCQFSGCWAPNPKIRTSWGDYCTKEHASLVALNEQSESLEVLNPEKRRAQITKVAI